MSTKNAIAALHCVGTCTITAPLRHGCGAALLFRWSEVLLDSSQLGLDSGGSHLVAVAWWPRVGRGGPARAEKGCAVVGLGGESECDRHFEGEVWVEVFRGL